MVRNPVDMPDIGHFEHVRENEVSDRFRGLLDRMSTPESTSTLGAAPSMEGDQS